MKKFASRLFVFLFIVPIFCLSGCFFFSDNPDFYANGEITTFKACYRNENYEVDNTISSYAELLVEQFYANFGVLNDYRYPSLVEYEPDANENSNYDKIRVQTNVEEINSTISWRWTFSQNLEEAPSVSTSEGAVEYYESPAVQNAYYSAFVPVYSVALEIVIYEIILNKTPTVFTVDIDNDLGSTKVYSDITKTKEVFAETETGACVPLTEIKAEFNAKAQYVGFTPANVQVLNNYILNNVIGENIIGGVYDTVKVSGQSPNPNLNYVLQQILQLEPVIEGTIGAQKSIYSPYPTSYIKDFNGSSFYVSSGSGAMAFEHIPALEYQSVILLPDENDSYLSIWLGFECEYNIGMTVSLNYYNYQTAQYSVVSSQELEIVAGYFSPNDIYLFDCEPSNKVLTFALEQLNATQPIVISNSTGLADFYNIEETSKIGILNKSKINQSYFEFTFVINKTTLRDYYPFKVGVTSVFNA